MKNIRISLIIFLSLFICSMCFIWYLQIRRSSEILYIGQLPKIQGAFLFEDSIYINSDRIYKLSGGDLSIEFDRSGLIYGVYEDTLVLCTWTNHEILSRNEIATDIVIREKDGVIKKEFGLHNTVAVTYCSDKGLILIDSYANSPGRVYHLPFTDDLKEALGVRSINREVYSVVAEELEDLVRIAIQEDSLEIFEIDNDKFLIQEMTGEVWLYPANL